MQHPDEGTIHTWLDGELAPADAAALEQHVNGCAECAAAVAEARGLVAASSRIVSALDVIPGGVIPAATRHARPWYARPQLRAAAALLVIAGGSLLVVRERPTRAMMDEAAPTTAMDAVAEAGTPAVGTGATAASPAPESMAVRAVAPRATAPSAIAKEKSAAEQPKRRAIVSDMAAVEPDEKDFSGQVAGGTVHPPATASPAAVPRRDAIAMRSAGGNATAAPAASAPTAQALRQTANQDAANPASSDRMKAIRTDTTGPSVRTVYEVSPGVEATLVETPAESATSKLNRGEERRKVAAEAATLPPPPPPPAALGAASVVNSLTWTSRVTGRKYVLSGPIPRQQLEQIRRQLPPEKR